MARPKSGKKSSDVDDHYLSNEKEKLNVVIGGTVMSTVTLDENSVLTTDSVARLVPPSPAAASASSSTKRIPKKKGKKLDMSKFRVDNFAAITIKKKSLGNYVNVVGLAAGVMVAHVVKVSREGEEEPFLRYFKDDIRDGLNDMRLKVDSPKAAIVKNLGICLMCPRRAIDGGPMAQNDRDHKDYHWMQFVSVLSHPDLNTPETRRKFQQKVVDYLMTNEQDERYTYPMKFHLGEDLSNPNGLLQVSTNLTNSDAAILFRHMYPINRKDILVDLLNSEQLDEFFTNSDAGAIAVKSEFDKYLTK